MNDWQIKFAPRWEKLRLKAPQLGWLREMSPFVYQLAEAANLRWYQTRNSDRVASFISLELGKLARVRAFGRTKIQCLIEILEAASSGVDAPTIFQSPPRDCFDVLRLWEIPDDYPLNLLPLPSRLMTFCETEQILSLPALLDIWAKLGADGLLKRRNIGKQTVIELHALVEAISNADSMEVRRWLPLHDSGKGLCLDRALEIASARHSESKRSLVARRLVYGLTLEEAGLALGMTRERVRQVEVAYMRDVEDTLNWFEPEKETMLEAWAAGQEWKTLVKLQTDTDSEALILAAIETCFKETPQGIVRGMDMEDRIHGWINEITDHPDLHLGGVDLQKFLDARVPLAGQESVILALSRSQKVVIDNACGLVKPAVPRVCETVRAILSREVEPLPLTQLALLVQFIEGCEQGDALFIHRNRYRWSQSGHLDLKKVIWDR